MKMKIFSLIIIAILAVSAIGSISAISAISANDSISANGIFLKLVENNNAADHVHSAIRQSLELNNDSHTDSELQSFK
ncbi:MAG: hypothetical protein LBT10_05000 [Methanobrevibacter sp.]|nr:hypothetical protein [Methanobrevibacter sp.]